MPRIAPIIAIAAALCVAVPAYPAAEPSPAHADAEPAPGEASGTSALTPSQRTRLETAADASLTVDEAAFYALLESVRDRPPAKAGSVFPDYTAIRQAPAAHRGQQVYIEGRLLTVTEPLKLGREGFDGVRPFIIQIDRFDQPWSQLTADDMVIVYVLDPLAVSRPDLQLHPKLLAQTGAKVRVAARFYKVKADKTEAGVTKLFLAFVAHSAQIDADTTRMDPTVRNTLLFTCGIAAMLVYWFIRIAGMRRRRRESRVSQVDEFLQQRERRRKEQALATGEDDERPADLPDDPIAALAALEQRRKQTADPPAFTLDDPPPPDEPANDE